MCLAVCAVGVAMLTRLVAHHRRRLWGMNASLPVHSDMRKPITTTNTTVVHPYTLLDTVRAMMALCLTTSHQSCINHIQFQPMSYAGKLIFC